MSYGISATGATKGEARAALVSRFNDDVLRHQPVHEKDLPAIFANVDACLALVKEGPNQDVSITINGYLSWSVAGADARSEFDCVRVDCAIRLTERAA